MKRIFSWLGAVLMLCSVLILPADAAQESTVPYIQRLIQYYQHYQEAADEEIATLLDYIASEDPGQGALWKAIMEDWSYNNSEMPVYQDVLPDGLPQDDSLCIVVLGYDLKDDGSMREELIDRLVVALASAIKYPNAYVCVTGGQTSAVDGVSEAGQMASWLREKGLEERRIIVEPRSLSTTENALKVYDILAEQYPQVSSLAIVSSDYHIPWGCTMFTTVSHYREYQGRKALNVVSCAANATANTSDTMYSQAWGIAVITGIPYDGSAMPAMYWAEETTVGSTQQQTAPVTVQESEDRSWMAFPAVMIGLAAVILLIPTKKKKKA